MIRVSAPRSYRRAGFRFGPERVELGSDDLLPAQLARLVRDPVLRVEITEDGETWFAPPPDFTQAIGRLADATSNMSKEQIMDAVRDGTLETEITDATRAGLRDTGTVAPAAVVQPATADDVRRAELAAGGIAATQVGAGQGAAHPDRVPGAPVPQFVADPNPALPAAGGTSDAGLEVYRATTVTGTEPALVDLPEEANPVPGTPDAAVVDLPATDTVVRETVLTAQPVETAPIPAKASATATKRSHRKS